MVFNNNIKSFINVAILGILAGALCALLDLIPANNIWTFSSFSGSLGFWALTGMLILMQSKDWKLAGINTFIYFGLMNATFFFVYVLLPVKYPRIISFAAAIIESLIWLIPSFICGIFAIVAYQAKKNNWLGIIALSLPLGLLLSETISLICSVIINHKYLFQVIIDIIGFIIIFFLYKDKKNTLYLVLTSILVAGVILGINFLIYHNLLYY